MFTQKEEKEDPIKDAFYSTLERVYDTIPSNEIKIVLGDLNVKIGRETIDNTPIDDRKGEPTRRFKQQWPSSNRFRDQ